MDIIPLLLYAIFALEFVFCIENEEHESLILTEINEEFHLTLPGADKGVKTVYFHAPEMGKTYRYCPNPKDNRPLALHQITQINPGTFTNEVNICQAPVTITLARVYNGEKIKTSAFNNEEMDLLHAGFVLFNADDRLGKKKNGFSLLGTTEPQYDDYVSQHKLVLLVEYYYHKTMSQTVAAEYILLPVRIIFSKKIKVHEKTNFLPGEHYYYDAIQPLFLDVDSEKYLEHFEGTIDEIWMKKWREVGQRNPLSLVEFASHEHFVLPLWALSARFPFNYIPLWKIPKLMWLRVEIYARITAMVFGELKVTAGITGTMTLSGKEVVDKNGFKMPKYFWKIFQLNKNRKTYGIIIVLNCNPFEKTEKTICETVIDCEDNGWVISNHDYSSGEIYCCDMTSRNIKNLKATFLPLKRSEKVFSLYDSLKGKVYVESVFKDIIKDERYKIPVG